VLQADEGQSLWAEGLSLTLRTRGYRVGDYGIMSFMKLVFLEKETRLFSRALVAAWRLCCLGAGIALLCVGLM